MTSAAGLEARAREILRPEVFAYYGAGSGAEQTLGEQERAWRAVELRPRVLTDVSRVSTATTLLGHEVAAPVLVAPTARHDLAHPDGEIATARGASKAGVPYIVSMRAGRRMSDIAATAGTWWQQIYVLRDRGVSDEVARAAADLGATALVVTVDTPYVARKAVEAPTPVTGLVPALDSADAALAQAADVVAADLAHLRDISGLPVVAKGVLRGDQAVRCIDAGADAVVVSTHGGRQLDGVVDVPRALAEVVETVGDRAEVYADGGVRSGVDVVRALGLGARAVLLGRPVLWALAVGGQDGVSGLFADLVADVGEALALAGCRGPYDVGADLVRFRT